MSPDGQRTAAAIVATFPMTAGVKFDWHAHTDHQLAWAPEGTLTVLVDDSSYILPPTRALWIPARTPHETSASSIAVLRSVYIRPNRSPLTWPTPTPVAVSPLLAELICHLNTDNLTARQRTNAETLLFDLLVPIRTATIEVRMPTDPRARELADALVADPTDSRTLDAWGRHIGASSRTLARAFLADTGLSFGRWRTLVRLRAALPHLATGSPVNVVADLVGYQTTSAFVDAFHAHTGMTPGRYFRATPPANGPAPVNPNPHSR